MHQENGCVKTQQKASHSKLSREITPERELIGTLILDF
jgi:hypothetical protein